MLKETQIVDRRKFIYAGLGAAFVVAAGAAAYLGTRPEQVKTVEKIVTQTVTAAAPGAQSTVTQTVTAPGAERTVTQTQIRTVTAAPAAPAAPPPVTAAGPKETFIMSINLGLAISIDPAKTFEKVTNIINVQLYDRLLELDASGNPGPSLATAWEKLPDGVTWIFKIRKGVKFANGDPMTAKDLEYSFRRVIKVKGPIFAFYQYIALIDPPEERVKALDEWTLQLKLARPIAPSLVLQVLATYPAAAVNSKLTEPNAKGDDMGSAWLEKNSAGTGPFVLEKFEKDIAVEMRANELYWKGAPQFKKISFKHIPDQTTQLLLLEKGDIDAAFEVAVDPALELEKNPAIKIHRVLDLNMKHISVNLGVKPFENVKVREAMRYALDYEGIVKGVLRGEAIIQQSIVPQTLLGGNPRTPYKKDNAKAKQLLAEAGYPNGFDMELYFVQGSVPETQVAPKVQADFADVGIKAKLVPALAAELGDRRSKQALPSWIVGWGGGLAHAENYVGAWTDYDRKSYAWWMKFDDPKAKELTAKTGVAKSDEESKKLYEELTEHMFQNGPYIVYSLANRLTPIRAAVKGFRMPFLYLFMVFEAAYKE